MQGSSTTSLFERSGQEASTEEPAGSEGSEGVQQLTPEVLWKAVTATLRAQLSEGNFSAWFGNARPIEFEDDRFVLGVPNAFTKEWIDGRHLDALQAAVHDCAGLDVSVSVVADDSVVHEDLVHDEPVATVAPAVIEAAPLGTSTTDGPRFHPKYTFDSFVIGSSNRFAHAAALAVAEAPAGNFNPLFIYGPAGLGKTHLLNAIGHYVRQWHPSFVIRYVSTEQFMNDFILAVRRGSIPEFHARYRTADLLLVDDIQILEGKSGTQEEFFHTFNALHPKSQIVITSDRPPKNIGTLEERLRTRFAGGLITDIQPPDLETRLAILQKKAEAEQLAVPDDVMSFIASRIQTNIRELEGALIRVAAYASLTRSHVTLELAQDILQSLLPHAIEARVTSDLVIAIAADYFDVTAQEICSPNRSRPLVMARQMAMYLCRELTDLSLPKIGERFGGKDHTTVIHAEKKIRKLMHESQSCYEQVQELTARIRQQAARG